MKKTTALLLACACCLYAQAQVTTVQWDPAATGPTIGPSGGAGTWNFTSAQWFDGAADIPWNNAGTYRAVFDGTNGGQVQVATGLIPQPESVVINKPGYVFTGGGARRFTVVSGIIEANADAAINMIITNAPSATSLVGIIKKGAGRLSFGVPNNTFLGGLYVLGGTVVVTDKQQIGGADMPVTVDGGTLEFGATANVSDRVLYIGDGGCTIHIPVASHSWLFQINQGTNGTLTKTGDGVFNLGNNINGGSSIHISSRTGPTIIEEGTLGANTSIGSALGTGPVTVKANGTLAGTGLIGGSVAVMGTISPAGSGGTNLLALPNMTLANGLDMSQGGTCEWQLFALADDTTGSPRSDFDRISITNGTLVLGGSSKLSINFAGTASAPDLANPFWQANHAWTVIALSDTAANPASGNFASIQNASYPAGTFSTSVDGSGSIVLTFTTSVVPDPAPHIESIVNQGNTNVIITWTSVNARSYQAEYNNVLTNSGWAAFTNLTATDAITTVTNSPDGAAERFYRILMLPQ